MSVIPDTSQWKGVRGFWPGFPAFREVGLCEELSPAVYMCLSHLGMGVPFLLMGRRTYGSGPKRVIIDLNIEP